MLNKVTFIGFRGAAITPIAPLDPPLRTGTVFPHLSQVLLWNEFEAISKWLFSTPFLLALHPWAGYVDK